MGARARRMRASVDNADVSTVAESEDCDRVGCMVFHGKCKHNHVMSPLSQAVFPGSKVHLQNLHGYCPGCKTDTIMKHRSCMECTPDVDWTFRFLVWGGDDYQCKRSSRSQKQFNFDECFPPKTFFQKIGVSEHQDAVFESAEFSITGISQ